jgi:hypothetical protein
MRQGHASDRRYCADCHEGLLMIGHSHGLAARGRVRTGPAGRHPDGAQGRDAGGREASVAAAQREGAR